MEKRTGLISTQKDFQQLSPLAEGIRWENFDDSTITLTEEEKEFALRVFLEKKIANIREILWKEKVDRKPENRKLDPSQVLHIVAKQMCSDINIKLNDFVLSPEFEVYRIISLYFSASEEFESLKEGYSLEKGIKLFGNVGCGKTTLMNAFRIIAPVTFPIVSCVKIANEYKKDGVEAIEKYINMHAICLDDLGIESTSRNFGDEKNVLAEIILGRYDKEAHKGFKTHITTNLSAEKIEEYYGPRVRSRMREMVNQIAFPEDSIDKRK